MSSKTIDFKSILAISGKPGLFIVLKRTQNRAVVQSMEDRLVRFTLPANQAFSVLSEIAIYITGEEDDSISLDKIFRKIYKQFKDQVSSIDLKDNKALIQFLEDLLPNYDRDRVYPSDIKKLIKWYTIISKTSPELLNQPEEEKNKKNEEKKGEKKKAAAKKEEGEKKVTTKKAAIKKPKAKK